MKKEEHAILANGCFWCTESVFKNINGVISITPGYMGGDNANPTYEEVCEGYTNHVEVIKVEYNQSLSLHQILSIFFSIQSLYRSWIVTKKIIYDLL